VLTDQALVAANQITLGQGIAFLAILSDSQSNQTTLTNALKGTPYAYYETQGVYRQTDSGDPPRILFLHWMQKRQPGDGESGPKTLEPVAAQLNGQLVLATQVPGQTSTVRGAPSMPFTVALGLQLGTGPGPGPTPGPQDIPPVLPNLTPPASHSWLLPGLVGLGLAVGVFAAVRAARKSKSSSTALAVWRP
jgi:hypothetical protein